MLKNYSIKIVGEGDKETIFWEEVEYLSKENEELLILLQDPMKVSNELELILTDIKNDTVSLNYKYDGKNYFWLE